MITLRPTTFGRTPLDERSVHRREIYLTKHNTQEADIHARVMNLRISEKEADVTKGANTKRGIPLPAVDVTARIEAASERQDFFGKKFHIARYQYLSE
jgi:hypothetical protein